MTDAIEIIYHPIGWIRSPFQSIEGMPIQPAGARDIHGKVELDMAYVDGLKDLDGFSHIILIYHFHLSSGYSLQLNPFLDSRVRGLFATRAPKRPNPIGVSIVRLDKVDNATLHIRDVDIVDGTPLLDIKPYVPDFDAPGDVRIGWLGETGKALPQTRSDKRFQ